jgi:hypothetical protein
MGSTGVPTTKPGIYTTVKGSRHSERLTRAKNREHNDQFVFSGDANLTHTPQFWVGIFNVSGMEHRIDRPWVHPGKRGQLIVIPAAAQDEPFGTPFVIPDIVQMPEERPGSWQMRTFGQDGRFLAQDALNPEDPAGNWRTMREIGAGLAANENTNLYRLGCFWITAKTREELYPNEEEIETAHTRLEATYNTLIEDANLLFLTGADGQRQIGHTHRRAANYFGIETEWNKKYTRKIACPNCAEPLNPAAATCTKCPAVLNWERAIALGLRSIQQAMDAGIIPDQARQMQANAATNAKRAKGKGAAKV